MDMPADLLDRVSVELSAMTRYALDAGLPVGADIVALLTPGAATAKPDVAGLVAAHRRMAVLVAPATPGGLALLHADQDAAGRWSFLGPVRLVRRLLTTAVVFLGIFVLTSLSGYVSHDSGGLFDESGLRVLIPLLFLMAAAGMGAAFSALFRVERYVVTGTFDPTYEASYWVHVVLGVMAGVLLAELIPVDGETGGNRPLLALLGGFSASVVHGVLVRLVETLESLVGGPPDNARRRVAPAHTSPEMADA